MQVAASGTFHLEGALGRRLPSSKIRLKPGSH